MEEIQKGTLYVVATPIGNLDEITHRAVRVLSEVDLILCEDTRHTLGLCNALGISKPLRAHHKFNEKATVDGIVQELKGGATYALVSDAGMPCISDPGNLLVNACREQGVPCTVVSGPCALVNALVLSGMDTAHFCFVGFLPDRNRDRKELLNRFAHVEATLVFYVPPHGLNRDLKDLYEAYGARKACFAREITKLHEEVVRFTLTPEPDFTARGEYGVLVEAGTAKTDELLTLSTREHLDALLAQGMDQKSAIKAVASARGLSKNEVYQLTVKD